MEKGKVVLFGHPLKLFTFSSYLIPLPQIFCRRLIWSSLSRPASAEIATMATPFLLSVTYWKMLVYARLQVRKGGGG
jgi:hypothetical protein